MSRGCYFVYDRLKYLESKEFINLKDYMRKWEITRSTAFRDFNHLRLFQNINFRYDSTIQLYRREKD